jgi:hypothetical protein
MPYLLDLRTNTFRPHESIEKSERNFLARLEMDFDTLEVARKPVDYQTRNAWKCRMSHPSAQQGTDKHHFDGAPYGISRVP